MQKRSKQEKKSNSNFSFDLILDNIQGYNKFFPKRKLKKPNYEKIKLNSENFTLFKNAIVTKNEYFTIIEAFNTKKVRKYFVKMYKKSVLRLNPWLKKAHKIEIALMNSLEKSKSFLKFEGILQDEKHISLVYQSNNKLNFSKLKNTKDEFFKEKNIKKLEAQIVIGLAELNSFGLSVVNFSQKNVFYDEDCNFVIGLFEGIFEHGVKINKKFFECLDKEGNMNTQITVCHHVEVTLTPSGKSDSWSIGVFLLRCFNLYMKFNFIGKLDHKFENNFFESKKIPKSSKDLIECLTDLKEIKRVFVQDIMLHTYFSPFLIQQKFIEQIEALSPVKTPHKEKGAFEKMCLLPLGKNSRNVESLVSPRHMHNHIHRHQIKKDNFVMRKFQRRKNRLKTTNMAEMKRAYLKKTGSFQMSSRTRLESGASRGRRKSRMSELPGIEVNGVKEDFKKSVRSKSRFDDVGKNGRRSRSGKVVRGSGRKSGMSQKKKGFFKELFGFFGCFEN